MRVFSADFSFRFFLFFLFFFFSFWSSHSSLLLGEFPLFVTRTKNKTKRYSGNRGSKTTVGATGATGTTVAGGAAAAVSSDALGPAGVIVCNENNKIMSRSSSGSMRVGCNNMIKNRRLNSYALLISCT